MSSHRAYAARRLASLLAKDTGVDVAVCYQRRDRCYRVRWQDGPTILAMRVLAFQHAGQVRPLPVTELIWERS